MNVDVELEEAHQDYEERKTIVINQLKALTSLECLMSYEIRWIQEAIDFIKEKEI